VRGRRLELLRQDPLADFEHDVLDGVGIALIARDGHLEIVEHVVVGLVGALELPVFACSERVERELDVVAQLLGGLGA